MQPPMPDTSPIQLRCLIAVVEAGSFAGAAKRLGLSTSAVSKTIGRMEAARGAQLLHRSTHSVSLTGAGERVLDAARRLIAEIEHFEDAIADVSGAVTGSVRITAPVAFVRRCIVPLLGDFSRACPGILLDLRGSDDFVDLADEAMDLALRAGSFDNLPGLSQQPWFEFRWVTAASPEYLAINGVPLAPADLERHCPIAFRNGRSGLPDPWWFRSSREDGVESIIRYVPRPSLMVDDADSACAAAALGSGIVFAPHWLVATDLAEGRLVEILSGWSGEVTRMSIVRRSRNLTPKRVEAVIAFLKRHKPA